MQRRQCISCGHIINKSGLTDPYICRDCENLKVNDKARYAYLDNS